MPNDDQILFTRKPVKDDASLFFSRIEASDRAELNELTAGHGCRALENIIDGSGIALAMFDRNGPSAMAGVLAINEEAGWFWSMASKAATASPVFLVRRCLDVINEAKRRFRILRGVTDCRYEKTMKLMTWLGFRYGEQVEVKNRLLRQMEWRQDRLLGLRYIGASLPPAPDGTQPMTDVESLAREFAGKITAAPGWAAEVDIICAAARDMLMATAASIAGTPAKAAAIADQVEVILRELAAAEMAGKFNLDQ